MNKLPKEREIKILIEIGKEAEQGKICNQCGRNFKKSVGYKRLCTKCKKGE